VSVAEVHPVRLIPWRAGLDEIDPAYPSGRWFSHIVITGDASTGVIEAQMDIELAAKGTSRLYTVENVDAHRVDGTADNILMRLVGFGQDAPDSPDLARVVATIGTGAALAYSAMPPTVIPWGFPFYHRPGADLSLIISFNTNTTGITYRFTAWGWIWEGDSYRTPTGPRKPW